MTSKRIDCQLCGGDIYPEHASGMAINTETDKKIMVCINCDGLIYTSNSIDRNYTQQKRRLRNECRNNSKDDRDRRSS